jgi:hypothetical protein
MHGQIGDNDDSDVIRFERAAKTSAPDDIDQLDKAGQTILQLVQRAAGVAEENSKHAIDMAQKLSHRLRAAEERLAALEAEAASCQDQAARAEQWLHTVYTEIESRFLRREQALRGAPQR